jgi:HK97 family phage major capsid protein
VGPADRKTLTEGADGSGGFLVPPDFHADVIKKQMTYAQVRALATVVQTSRDVVQWPRVNYTSNPTDDPSSNRFTSGIRLTWTGETPASSTASRVTEPVFGLYNIPVNVALATMPLANSLLEDTAFDVMGLSSDLFAEAFALGEEDAFINGGTGTTSVSRPVGIIGEVDTNGPSSLQTAGAGTIAADDIIKLFYGVAVQYRNKGKFLMSTPAMQALELLKDAQNRYIISSLINGASLQQNQFDSIKGRQVLISEFVPNALTTGNLPIIFGDLSGYMIVDRVGLSVQKLSELYAETDVTLLLARKRVGGYTVRPWQMRVLKVQ